jgi:hypothetical protein
MPMRPAASLSPREVLALKRLRRIAATLPGSVETVTFGHPTFKVGSRSFAVLDRYDGHECLWLRADPLQRAKLLAMRGWFESPYDPRKTALCGRLGALNWRRVPPLVCKSHALAEGRPTQRRR